MARGARRLQARTASRPRNIATPAQDQSGRLASMQPEGWFVTLAHVSPAKTG